MLGRSGLDINDPVDKYKLKSLPGTFTGLHLQVIMFTAFRQIDPTMETGADFGVELRPHGYQAYRTPQACAASGNSFSSIRASRQVG